MNPPKTAPFVVPEGNVVQEDGTPSASSAELRKIKPTSELVLFPKSVFMLP